MPNEEGRLSDEETKHVIKWLKDHSVSRRCPACGESRLLIEERIGKVTIYQPEVMAGGPLFPYVILICDNCGNSLFFNALKLELYPKETQEEEEEEETVSDQKEPPNGRS